MQAAASCLPPHGLRVPVATACPALGLEQGGRALPLWRPWLPRAQEGPGRRQEQMDPAQTRDAARDGGPDKALSFFRHPVRLLWPKSKAFDHLYAVGEKLLENFPVQATLCFYEDSGSEEEEEEEEEEEKAGDVTAGGSSQAGSSNPGKPL